MIKGARKSPFVFKIKIVFKYIFTFLYNPFLFDDNDKKGDNI